MSNVDDLKGRLKKLLALLEDPHPGLWSWNIMYQKAATNVLDFFKDDPPETARDAD